MAQLALMTPMTTSSKGCIPLISMAFNQTINKELFKLYGYVSACTLLLHRRASVMQQEERWLLIVTIKQN